MLAHAAAKGNAFMGAGVLRAKFGTKQISAIRGGLDLLPRSGPHLEYSSDVIEVVGTYLYRPGRRLFDVAVRTAKRLQSGRLDAYLLYMLIALIAIIAVVTALA